MELIHLVCLKYHNYSQISAKYHGLQSWSFSEILLLIMWGGCLCYFLGFHKTIEIEPPEHNVVWYPSIIRLVELC